MEYLLISLLGPSQLMLMAELTALVTQNDCNIEDTRLSTMAGICAITMMISGNWSTISKLETAVANLAERAATSIMTKRTKPQIVDDDLLPYTVQVTTLDQPGLVYEITHFFATRSLLLEELYTHTYISNKTGTSLFTLTLDLAIPADISIAELREQFAVMCDELNIDGVIEPNRD